MTQRHEKVLTGPKHQNCPVSTCRSYPGVQVHPDRDFFWRRGLNKHLVPLTRCVAVKTDKLSLDQNRSVRPAEDDTYCSKLMYLTTVLLDSSTQRAHTSDGVSVKSTRVS